ncbi:XRE family transcriptional regulator [Devosia sp.]|uniref:helix-turn-helix domain-containing protein n=1 Tax=Devosia sp. TaxID=1871048 RepID=UPI003265114A
MAIPGDMLRLARQRLGFTQIAAATKLGIPQPVLSRIESGVAEVDAALLLKASSVYSVPQSFFEIQEPVFGPPVSVHAMTRAKADVTARELDMIAAELNIRLFHLRWFLDGVDFGPTTDLPSLDVEQYGDPSRIAATVRAHWGVPSGPVKNVTQLAERAGIIVGMSDFRGAAVSGVTFRAPGKPPLVLLNKHHPADRLRFTLSHEIGHLVMHRFPTAEMEAEANAFASAFLLPEREIRAAFRGRKITLETLAALKPEWRVAIQALLMRASGLKLLTANQSRYLWTQISSRGWRTHEPPELDFAAESPRVLPSIVESHIVHLGYKVEELATMSRLHVSEFIEMYGLPSLEQPPERPRFRIVS